MATLEAMKMVHHHANGCFDWLISEHHNGNPSIKKSVPWVLAEFYFNKSLQRLYTGTCIILQKTINGFLCPLIVFLKSKTHQLNLKDVIKLNRNLW